MRWQLLLALFTGLQFGIIPARQVCRTGPNQALKPSSPQSCDAGSPFATFCWLFTLPSAACSLRNSFIALRKLQHTSDGARLGFQPEGVVLTTLDVHLQASENAETGIQKKLLTAVQAIASIQSWID